MSDANFGYGQESLFDAGSEFNVIDFIVRQGLTRMVTMKVVRVVKVTPGESEGEGPAIAGTVDVQPLVNQIDGNGNATPHGVVHGLPYLRIQAGTWAIVVDPRIDDIGLVVVSDRDISAVKTTKQEANPGSRRRFDLADGVYIGGILNAKPTSFIELKEDGSFKISASDGKVLESSEDGFTLTGNLTVVGDLEVEGNVTATEEVTAKEGASSVGLSTHRHTSAAAGNPTSPPTAGT